MDGAAEGVHAALESQALTDFVELLDQVCLHAQGEDLEVAGLAGGAPRARADGDLGLLGLPGFLDQCQGVCRACTYPGSRVSDACHHRSTLSAIFGPHDRTSGPAGTSSAPSDTRAGPNGISPGPKIVLVNLSRPHSFKTAPRTAPVIL